MVVVIVVVTFVVIVLLMAFLVANLSRSRVGGQRPLNFGCRSPYHKKLVAVPPHQHP